MPRRIRQRTEDSERDAAGRDHVANISTTGSNSSSKGSVIDLTGDDFVGIIDLTRDDADSSTPSKLAGPSRGRLYPRVPSVRNVDTIDLTGDDV